MSDALSSMTPEQLAQTPAGIPPPGVIPSLVSPPSDGPVLILIGAILMAIMLLLAGIRLYFKALVRRKLSANDWTTIAAVIGACWYYGICIHAVTRAKFGTHIWDISVAHTLSDDFLVASFFTNWPTGLVWAFAKTSFLVMYLQIFSPMKWLRICVYIGLFVNWGFYVAVIVASIYYQAPNSGQTWQEGFQNERYMRTFNMALPIGSGSLILDTYIFILPLIAIQSLQLTLRKKIGVFVVFATGFIMPCVFSQHLYKTKLDVHLADYTYWTYPVLLMSLVEMCVGISCSCMPSVAGFLNKKRGGLQTWGSSVFGLIRSMFHSSRRTKTSVDIEHSAKSGRPYDGSNHCYVDLDIEQSSVHKLTSADHWGRRPE